MYCKERYTEIVPFAMKPHGIRNIQTQLPPIIYMCICTFNLLFTKWENSLADCLYPNITCPFQNGPGLPLRFCILQVIKSWTRGRPGNEASSYLGSVTCTRPIFLRKLMKAQWGFLVLLSEHIAAILVYHHCGKFLTEMVQSIVDPCNASLCPDNSVRVYAEISLLAS